MESCMKQVTDDTFDATVLKAGKPVVVDFTAAWCGPCKLLKQVLARYADDHPEVEVVVIDVDTSPRTGSRYGVQGMPTMMLFNEGRRLATLRGLQNGKRVARFVSEGLRAN